MLESKTIITLSLISGVSFIFYGLGCFKSIVMKREFERYGLSQLRILTGVLQLLGGLGLITGLYLSNILAFISSLGLSILMLLGFGVRLKIRDSFWQSLPSISYMLLNAYLCVYFFEKIV